MKKCFTLWMYVCMAFGPVVLKAAGQDTLNRAEIYSIETPSHGRMELVLNGDYPERMQVEVYNIIGNRIYTTRVQKENDEKTSILLDKQFQPGMYFVMISAGGKPVKKFKVMIN